MKDVTAWDCSLRYDSPDEEVKMLHIRNMKKREEEVEEVTGIRKN